jgi:hypothetical protein
MIRERTTLVLALLSAVGLTSACTSTKACTEIGCVDQFSATIEAASASLRPGDHELDVTVDEAWLSCRFSIPVEPIPMGGLPAADCDHVLTLFVGPAVTCTTFDDGAVKGQRCDPVPGRVQERLTVTGTPTYVGVRQWAGDTLIFTQMITPIYELTRPNGPECEPTCRQASATWSIP